MAAIARVPYVTSYLSQHQPANWKYHDAQPIFQCKYRFQVNMTDRWNKISYLCYGGNVEIGVIGKVIHKFVIKELI